VTTATAVLAAPRPATNKWLVTVSVSFGTLMGAIDTSIVNVALPHIRGSVGATVEEITWITTGFVIATVIVMPLTGFLGRLFGQKRVYLFSLALFLLGSALCGTARSLPALVGWRAVQGLGAGALQPTEQAILRSTFPPEEQGMAMAVFAMAVMLGPALGPTLGGYITDNYSWPWIFFINLPIGLLGMFMVWSFVHEDHEIVQKNRALAAAQRSNVDYLGIGLMVVGLATLQYFLEEGSRYDWFQDRTIAACFCVAVLGLAAFVWRELTAKVPVVNLRLFKDKTFASGTLIGAVMFALLMANMFLMPLFMQEMLGFTATQSGVALMPRVLVMMAVTPFVGRIYNRVSPRLVVAVGILLVSLGSYFQSHFQLDTSMGNVIRDTMVQGVGFACLFVPLTTVALSSIQRHQLADATGLNSLFRQVGGSIGLAIFATLLTRYVEPARAAISAHMAVTDPAVGARLARFAQAFMARGYDATSAQAAAHGALYGIIARQATVVSFEKVFMLAAIVFVAVLPLLYFLRSPHHGARRAPTHVEM
jgi:MFS transporter, DHA2 family, multidrug resistance protein